MKFPHLTTQTQSLTSILFSTFFFSGAYASKTFAQILEWTTENGCVSNEGVATIQGIECLIGNILASATTFIGLAAFVMLIIGGFLYLTSGSDSKGTQAAKQTITYAITGIIVALMAYYILQLIALITGSRAFLQFNLNIN